MFNQAARDWYAEVSGTAHMSLAWVKEWKASDWTDLPKEDVRIISTKVRKFRKNVKKLGQSKEEDAKLAVDSISILRKINVILLKNNVCISS